MRECPGMTFRQNQGVRQGGPMSPLLFNLAISDLMTSRPSSAEPNLFMDDLAIAMDVDDVGQVITKVELEVQTLG